MNILPHKRYVCSRIIFLLSGHLTTIVHFQLACSNESKYRQSPKGPGKGCRRGAGETTTHWFRCKPFYRILSHSSISNQFDISNLQESEARIDLLRQKNCSAKVTVTSMQKPSSDTEEPAPASPRNNAFPSDQHIDLFADYQEKITTAKPMDEEKRLEQEKYEKQIGYLTYLGQDTHEANRTRSWYDVAPKRNTDDVDTDGQRVEVGLKTKYRHDPMRIFAPFAERDDKPRIKSSSATEIAEAKDTMVATASTPEPAVRSRTKYTPIALGIRRRRSGSNDDESSKKKKKKHKRSDEDKPTKDTKDRKHKKKKSKKHKKEKESRTQLKEALERQKADKLALLREQRLRREAEERLRTYELLHGKAPVPTVIPALKPVDTEPTPFVRQKYNSQFNPFLAKQNFN